MTMKVIEMKKGVLKLEENNTTKDEIFEYTYSAKRQEEIAAIKKKYLPPEEDKMELLRKLDAEVTKHAAIRAIVIGSIGALIFGAGLSGTLVGTKEIFILGIMIGLVGLAVMGSALPIYSRVLRKEKEKAAPQILALIEELSR